MCLNVQAAKSECYDFLKDSFPEFMTKIRKETGSKIEIERGGKHPKDIMFKCESLDNPDVKMKVMIPVESDPNCTFKLY